MLMDRTDHKRRVAAVYNLTSAGYDRPELRFFRTGAERLVAWAGLLPGEYVLDVATGTGAAAVIAGRAVGPAGHVVGVDIAGDMLAQARRNVAAARLANVEVALGDAEQLDFAEGSIDAVLCASSIFFLPDMAAAARDWLRVLRPGGRLALTGYGADAFRPLSDLFEARLRHCGIVLPPHGQAFSWQRLTEPRAYRDLLSEAGCEHIEADCEQIGYWLPDPVGWWHVVWNSGFRGPLMTLAPAQLAAFLREHLREVADLMTDKGLWLDVPLIIAGGRKVPVDGASPA